jgi:hypothetical protein
MIHWRFIFPAAWVAQWADDNLYELPEDDDTLGGASLDEPIPYLLVEVSSELPAL